MRHIVLALLLAATVHSPSSAADRDLPAPVKTAKERQGGKAFDEQRMDDCKVPDAQRTRPRPASCPEGTGG